MEPELSVNDDPHADEDPEEHLGEETQDPWSDPEQLDWTSNVDDDLDAEE